jgi:hypothetical protein
MAKRQRLGPLSAILSDHTKHFEDITMKKLLLALAFLSSTSFAQAVVAPVAQEDAALAVDSAEEVAVVEHAEEEFSFGNPCDPSFLRMLMLCGEKFNPTVCTYGDLEIRGSTSCETNYRIRSKVCKEEGKFDESKISCESATRLRPRN